MLVRKISQYLFQTALIVLGGAAMMLMFTTPSLAQTQTVPEAETQLKDSAPTLPQDSVEKTESDLPPPASESGLSENSDTTLPQDDLEKTESDLPGPASEEGLSNDVSQTEAETDYQPVKDVNPSDVGSQETTVQ